MEKETEREDIEDEKPEDEKDPYDKALDELRERDVADGVRVEDFDELGEAA